MSRKLILLVDDDPDTLEAYAVLFQALGHATASVSDGAAAVVAALQLRPDVMLLDIGLPQMNGFEVLERIRADADGARIPVIVLTGRAFPDEIAEVHQHGCNKVLIKPCEPVALCEAVESVLHAPPAVHAPPDGVRRSSGAFRVRTAKPQRSRRRPAEPAAERSLESLCAWADFLDRQSEGLRVNAAGLIARARKTQAWSLRLRSAAG